MGVEWIALGYFGLFAGAFLSATLLPFPSEALVLGALGLGMDPWIVLLVATFGNLLGGLTNYWIGFSLNNPVLLRRFRLNEDKINRWEMRSKRWGYWLGLLAWLPFVGDPMLVALGFLRVRFWPLVTTIFLGKFIRYAVLIWFFFQW